MKKKEKFFLVVIIISVNFLMSILILSGIFYILEYLDYDPPNDQKDHAICSDGAGGAIITWMDYRNFDSTGRDIYAQKIDSNGNIKWILNGVIICNARNSQEEPKICSDGRGGAIIAWEDKRTGYYDIYAQRIDSNGNIAWIPNGIPVCMADPGPRDIEMCSDGNGGVIIVWEGNRDYQGTGWNIYTQRIDLNGFLRWNINGIPIFSSSSDEVDPEICSDGLGGAFIICEDDRRVTARRINSDGENQWESGMVTLSLSGIYHISICSDGAGGVIAVWFDSNILYAQKIDLNGNLLWDSNGETVAYVDSYNAVPKICSDGEEGAFIAWQDAGTSGDDDWDIEAQWINSNGDIQWTNTGKAICDTSNGLGPPEIINTTDGGAFIVWSENRIGVSNSTDIYGQRIKPDRELAWNSNGILLCDGDDYQNDSQLIFDESSGLIIAWKDKRNSKDYDIYAQRINILGTKLWSQSGNPIVVLSF